MCMGGPGPPSRAPLRRLTLRAPRRRPSSPGLSAAAPPDPQIQQGCIMLQPSVQPLRTPNGHLNC